MTHNVEQTKNSLNPISEEETEIVQEPKAQRNKNLQTHVTTIRKNRRRQFIKEENDQLDKISSSFINNHVKVESKNRTLNFEKDKLKPILQVKNPNPENPRKLIIEKSIVKAKMPLTNYLPEIIKSSRDKKILANGSEAEIAIKMLKEFRKHNSNKVSRHGSTRKDAERAEEKLGGTVGSYLTLPVMTYNLSVFDKPKKFKEEMIEHRTVKKIYDNHNRISEKKRFFQNLDTVRFNMKQIWQSQDKVGFIQVKCSHK